MNRIPFVSYDFFGYLASGLLVVAGMELVFGFPLVLGRDLKVIESAVLILAVYVAGQLVATPAKAILEDGLIDKILGRPSVNLLRDTPPLVGRILFRGFYQPLPAAIRARVLKRAAAEGITDTGEPLFLHVRFHQETRANEKLVARLDSFLNLYGFSRNLAFTSLVVGAALAVRAWWICPNRALAPYAVVGLIAGVALLYRYLKFFRQYSYELFNTYASGGK